jgi:hypothetical protein
MKSFSVIMLGKPIGGRKSLFCFTWRASPRRSSPMARRPPAGSPLPSPVGTPALPPGQRYLYRVPTTMPPERRARDRDGPRFVTPPPSP